MFKCIEIPQRIVGIERYAIADVFEMTFDKLMIEFYVFPFLMLNSDLPLIIKMAQSTL